MCIFYNLLNFFLNHIRENITPRGDGNMGYKNYNLSYINKREYNSERRRKPIINIISIDNSNCIRENITPRGDGNYES